MITVNGEKMQWKKGLTVRDVLSRKGWKFPDIALWIDGVPISPEKYDTTYVEDGARVETLHMVSGG